MAYFTTSALVNGQAAFNENVRKGGEWRMPDNAALRLIGQMPMTNPNLQSLQTTGSRTVSAYMPIRGSAGSGTALDEAHTGSKGDSASTSVTWTLYTEEFSISKKQADNNVLTWADMYAGSLRGRVYSLMNRLDALVVASILADKSGYCAGGGRGTFNTTPDFYEVPFSEKNYFYASLKSMMEFNLYPGDLNVIADTKAFTDFKKLSVEGSGNATNYGAQFMGIDVLPTTRTIDSSSAYDGAVLAWQKGNIGLIPWLPVHYRKPLDPNEAGSYNGGYGQLTVEGIPFPIGIHAYATRSDQSSYGGGYQDLIMYFQIFTYLGYLSSPLSSFNDATESVIFGAGQLGEAG